LIVGGVNHRQRRIGTVELIEGVVDGWVEFAPAPQCPLCLEGGNGLRHMLVPVPVVKWNAISRVGNHGAHDE
jgi:hypothetical protein